MRNPSRRYIRLIRDDFDGAWKNMLNEKRFASFIAFFRPEVYDEIDWTHPVEFLEQELRAITRKTKRSHRSVDKLVKVWLRDGTEKWVLVHIEIQSQEDPEFPYRMFQYYFRARDLFEGRSVACLAILGDDNENWKPDSYTDRLWDTGVEFRFRAVKLREYNSRMEELEQSANPFARFTLAHLKTLQTQGDYDTRLEWKLRIIKGLYDMGVSEDEIGLLYHDFDWLLALPESLAANYHREMTRFEEERTMPHVTTAERIGRAEGVQESILELLEMRQGSVSTETTAQIEQIFDINRLRALRKLLVTNAPLEDFVQALNASIPS